MDNSTGTTLKRTLFACVLCAASLAGHSSAADTSDGHWLAKVCMSDGVYEIFGCEMYLEGVWDALYSSPRPVCINGERPAPSRLREVVLRHLEAHPDQWDLPRVVLIDDAFRNAWPCGGQARADSQLLEQSPAPCGG